MPEVRESSLKLRESPQAHPNLQLGASEKPPDSPLIIPTPRNLVFSPDTNFSPSPVRAPTQTRTQYPSHSTTPVLASPPALRHNQRPHRNRSQPIMFNPGTATAARDWKSDMVVNLAATLNQKIWTPSEVKQLIRNLF